MNIPQTKHISCTLAGPVVVARLRFARHRSPLAYDEVAEELSRVAEVEGVRSVLLNLEALDHVTSRLLGAMAALSKRLSAEGRSLAVCRMRPEPLRSFRVCRLDVLIPVYRTEEEARAALMGPGGSN